MVTRTGEHEGRDPDLEPTDAELISESVDRPRAFMPLVERHHRILFGYLARRVGADVAEELVSETFARAFSIRERFDTTRADARPWLFGIAMNLMRTHLRSEARRMRAYARSGVDEVVHVDDAGLHDRLDAAVHGQDLAAALENLAQGDREALLLYAWGDLTYEEIAETIGIPVGTVRSRLNRARRQLKAALPQLETVPADSGDHTVGGER
jgi:RNA polymerase sigma-70 factor (ECF subfamily)